MIRNYIEEHRHLLTRLFSFVVMTVLTVFIVIEFRHFDFHSFQTIIQRYNGLHFLALALAGYISFLPSLSYDFLLANAYNIPIDNKAIMINALISQGFNNFITFGGSVGMKFRVDLYQKHRIESAIVIQISLLVSLASLLGLATYILPAVLYLGPIVTPTLRVMAAFSLLVPLFFLSDMVSRIPSVGRFLARHHYSPLKVKVKTKLWLAALVDWASSGSFFVLACFLLNPTLPILHLFSLYIVGQLVGIMSFVPGGIGSFDLTILILLKGVGMSSTEALLAIFLFRLLYNICPVLVSALIYLYQFIRRQVGDGVFASGILANLMVLAGLINISSVATPAIETRYQLLRQFLPPSLSLTAQYTTLFIGFILLITSQGIRHRLKSAYRINLVLLPLSAVFCLIKGFDYEEAILLLCLSFLLFSVRKIFDLPNLPFKKTTLLYTTLTALLGAGMFVAVYNTTHQVQFLTDTQAFSLAWFEDQRRAALGVFLILVALLVTPFFKKRK